MTLAMLKLFWPTPPVSCIVVLLFVTYYLSTAALILWLGVPYLRRAYLTDWFDVSPRGWLRKLNWTPDVMQLMTTDPLSYRRKVRGVLSMQALRDLAVLATAAVIWFAGIQGLRTVAACPTEENVKLATFLVGFLGLAGAVTKVTYEWRLKARSENRQRWIDQLREGLNTAISTIPGLLDDEAKLSEKKKAYSAVHAKLELLMNPSEKDHRALMALIRYAHKFDNVAIDDIARDELKFETLDRSDLGQRKELISRIIRLSNAVLKREWERVKHIQ